jgi:hypothetical protein
MAFIDESEIEDWFEEEKSKLNKTLYDASYAKKDVEKAKKKYDEQFAKLLKRYNKEHKNLTKRIERKRKFQKPFKDVKAWWKHYKKKTSKKWKARHEKFKKWRFDREYDRLMKK